MREASDSQVRRQLEAMLVDIGGQLARDPAIRAEINRGMVRVLADFVQSQKSGVGRFIADQVKSWDIDMLIGRIELTVGRDLQYIRFNGALIGGLAGLALHALEQGLKLGSEPTGGSHGRRTAELHRHVQEPGRAAQDRRRST